MVPDAKALPFPHLETIRETVAYCIRLNPHATKSKAVVRSRLEPILLKHLSQPGRVSPHITG